MSKRLRVGVVFGGRNSEHEVSLKSARAVMEALDQDKFEVVPIGIDKQGRWRIGGDPLYALEQASEVALLGREPSPGVVTSPLPVTVSAGRLPGDVIETDRGMIDVVVPVLHGLYGEDGTLQGLLEIADVPYVGCGVLAAAVGMDKVVMKAAFAAAGIPQVPYRLVLRHDWERARAETLDILEAELRYPIFTKPANAGSSVGVSKCRDRGELERGLDEASRHDRRLIVEQGVSHPRELEVAVLGNDDPVASIVGEIVPGNEWYDYQDKYLGGRTQYHIPAPIDEDASVAMRRLAVLAFKAIDGAGLARVDFLLSKDDGKIYLNEVNTFPGFTQISMYPKLWEATGLRYGELLERLVQLALERHQDRRVR